MKRFKGFLSLLLALLMYVGLLQVYSLTTFAADTDTSWYNDTKTSFTLYDAADLAGLASLVNAGNSFEGKTIVLENSIDLNSEAWTPIGTSSSYPFNGTFDGNDYTVSGLYINDSSSTGIRQALFGYNGGTVKNVTVSGNVTGYQNVGGVVGTNAGTVTNCTNCATVSATTYVGSVVGFNSDSGTVKNCYNSGSITSSGYLGGVVGFSSGSVANCINSGAVTSVSTGYDYVGGVLGYAGGGTVNSCYNSGAVSGNTYVGGVVGCNSATVSNCYYLSGTATAAIGQSIGSSTSVAAKTTTQFASGEVTWLLTGGVTDGTQAWYQTLGTDSYPVLDSTHGTVYYTTAGCNGSSVTGTYSNSSVIHAGNSYDNGFCTNCGAYQPATLNGSTYEISNAGQLFWFAALVNSDTTQQDITEANTNASAVLMNDITIPSGCEWTPIGTKSAPYTGTFDGDGYTVSGMSITTASTYMGLFGYVSAGTIKDLTVSGEIDVSGSSLYAGSIVGTVSNGTLSNLTSNVSVTAYDGKKGTFGGVAATVEDGSTMELCINNGKVTASGVLDCVGGLVGYMNSATITNCINYGTVDTSGGTAAASAGIYTGGIISYINNANAVVTNCVNVGTISSVDSSSIVSYTGAIVGRINQYVKEVSNCYYLSSEDSTLDGVGGNGSGVSAETTAKDADELASGEVVYLLNGSVSGGTTWYQTLSTDSYPVLDSTHGVVYYGTDCAGTAIYSNSTVPAATHSLTHVEPQEATCTETGNSEYFYCTVCGGYFGDSAGTETRSLSDVTIAAKGHSWGGTYYSWSSDRQTCTATRTCQSDSSHIEVAYATITSEVKTAATCTAYGEITYTGSFSVDWATQQTQVGIISATGHSYEAVVTEPTCTTGGYTTYICSVCGESYTADETEATGHSLTYTASENAITESCANGCGHSATATLAEPSSLAYDGSSKAASVSYDAEWMGDTPTVEYLDSSGTAVDADSVVNVGTYTAQITVGGATASVSFTITASVYYTLRAEVTDSGPFNPGDTVTANIYASTETEAEVGSFQFTLDYDGSMLTLDSLAVPDGLVSGASPNVETNGAALSCTIGGSYTLTVSDTPVLLATATFTVNKGVSTGDTATISLKGVELNESGTSSSGTVTVESAEVSFANITVTFAAGTGTSMTQQTAYAKYNLAGLYSDEARTTALTADTISGWVSAQTGYRLATEALWSDGTSATYTSANVLQQAFTSDATLTAQAVQQFTVTFAAGVNGTLTGDTTLTVDTGTILTEVDVPTPNPNAGYIFDGWDNDPVSATITVDTTFTARFVDGTYNLTFPTVTGVMFAVGETMTTQTTVTHGTDVTFTITASGVDVDAVYYSVAGSNPVPITADMNGYYTIPGDVITGDVSITITYSYAITYNLTNITSSNTAAAVDSGESYSTTLTGTNCYVLPDSITVTVGGTELTAGTDYTYDSSTGELTITNVTGSIVITATATDTSHSYDSSEVTTAATCTADGVMTYTCIICGNTYTEVIPATGHTTEIQNAKDATCTEDGYTGDEVCTVCGETITAGEVIPATGHSYGEGVITQEATCTEDGEITYTCTICGDTYTEVIPATGHTTEVQNAKEATCTEDGYTGNIVCTVCGETISTGEAIPATGHSYGEGVVTQEATCTEDGEITYTCTICGDTYTEVISATGHTTETQNAKAATCTEDGYTGDIVCTVCGETISTGEAIPATGHSYGEGVITQEATCTEDGEITYTCTICDDTYTEVIPATGHTTEVQNAIEATCTEDGYTGDEVCTICGETITSGETIPATGHTTEVQNAKEATCTEDGYTGDTVCTVCGETITAGEVIPATGHTTEIQNAKDATCTENGYTGDEICTVCGETITAGETIPATGHTTEIQNAKDATCTDDGYTGDEICTVCGETITAGETIPATGHTTEVQNAKDATCTEDGYTGDEVCTVCGETITAGETIPATGHTTEIQNAKDATCTEDGYTGDEVCTVCGETITAGETIPATGHTTEIQNAKAATCTEDGYTGDEVCTVCGETITAGETIPATGHSYVYTDNGDGTHNVSCENCDYTETGAACTYDENGNCIYCGGEEEKDEPVIDYIIGDVDNNGIITANDSAALLHWVLTGEANPNWIIHDVDEDGTIDAVDAAKILCKVLNSAYSYKG